MDINVTYSELNAFCRAASIGMTLRGISENLLELTYNSGALLPNITLKLNKYGFGKNCISFKYEVQGVSSFMFSLANFFSALPEGVEVNKDSHKLAIIPSKLKVFKNFNGKCHFKYFDIHYDRIEIGIGVDS